MSDSNVTGLRISGMVFGEGHLRFQSVPFVTLPRTARVAAGNAIPRSVLGVVGRHHRDRLQRRAVGRSPLGRCVAVRKKGDGHVVSRPWRLATRLVAVARLSCGCQILHARMLNTRRRNAARTLLCACHTRIHIHAHAFAHGFCMQGGTTFSLTISW